MAYPEDDTDEWLQAQPAPNLEPAAAGGAAGWARARELMNQQAQMQYKAPARFSQPVVAETAPEKQEWKTIAAMMLNMLGNKGRDLGSIAAGANDARSKELADWRRQNNPQALLDREMQLAQLRNADRQGFEQNRQVLGQQAGQEMQLANAEQSASNHLDSLAQHQGDSMRQEAQFAETGARSDKHFDATQNLSREQMRQSAGQAAASRAQAAQFHQDSIDQHLADQQTAAGLEHGRQEVDMERIGAANRARLAEDAAKKDAAARLEHNDLVSQSSSYSNDAKEALAVLPHLQTVNRILNDYKGQADIPGLGKFDSAIEPGSWTERSLRAKRGQKFIDDTLAMRGAIGRAATMDIKNISGANVPDAERAILMLQSGAGKMDERTARKAIEQMTGATKKELRGRAANREAAARAVLRGYGGDAESYLDPDPEPVPLQVGRYSNLRKVQ